MATNTPKPTTGMSDDTKTIITILTLIFFSPVGLILMWVWTHWKTWVKVLITCLFVLYFVFIFSFIATVFTLINPIEVTKQSRDTQRIESLQSFQKAADAKIASKDPNLNLCGDQKPPCVIVSNGKDSNTLSKDPINNSQYYYMYCSDGHDYEIDARLESKRLSKLMTTDDGNNPTQLELGSDLSLCQ